MERRCSMVLGRWRRGEEMKEMKEGMETFGNVSFGMFLEETVLLRKMEASEGVS